MIDVIIPVYNSHDTIRQTLVSLAFQSINNKIKVTLVDDCSSKNYNYLKDEFKDRLDLNIIKTDKNVGSGLARNYGLDNTSNEYIFFLDSDDLLYTYDSLELLYNEIKQGYDYVDSVTLYEKENKVLVGLGELHGKIYRRSFLKKKNIRFNSNRFHEDNAFNSLVILNNPKSSHLNAITYVYCKNNNSITNVKKDLFFQRLELYIDTINYVVIEANKRKCNKELISKYIYQKYLYLTEQYIKMNTAKRKILQKWLKKYDFSQYLDMLEQEELRNIAIIL